MAKKYLDDSGLLYFWQQIKTKFATASFTKIKVGSTEVEADGTADTLEFVGGTNITITPDATNDKLTISTTGEANQNAFSNIAVGDVTVAADTTTDTLTLTAGNLITLTPDATNDAITIATTAEANQNAFSNIAVGSTTIAADSATDTLTLTAGTGITLTPDATNDSITITSAAQNQNAFSNVKVGEDVIAADAVEDTIEIVAGSNITLTADTTNDKLTIAATDTTYTGTAPITVSNGAISHDASGVTAGSYGSSSAQTPAFGATASVPYFTVDAKGHLTAAGATTVTIPSTAASADGAGLMSASDYTKLSGIEAGAQVNTITGVKGDAESSYRTGNVNLTPANIGAVATSVVGAASGVCPLDSNGLVDTSYLPSYVDDVIEAYPRTGQTELSSGWLSLTSGGAALTPETGKIYIILAASTSYAVNTQFRWSGTTYVELADANISAITNGEIDTILAS